MKSLLQSSLLFLTTFLFSTMSWGQQTLINETLSSGFPTGWNQSKIEFYAGPGGYARFKDSNSVLTTPTFDSSANASIDIEFDVAKGQGGPKGDGPLTVEYSLDGGTSWTTQGNSTTPTSSTYQSNTISISSTSATMRVRFTRESSDSRKRLRNVVITGLPSSPTITLSETTLSGLDYLDGNGPSTEQTFTAEGSILTDDITVSAPTNFEISTTSGSGFGSSVTLTVTSGSVSSTTIYVRLASGLAVNTYSGTLSATSTGATQQDVSLSGEVTTPSYCSVSGDAIIYDTSITEVSFAGTTNTTSLIGADDPSRYSDFTATSFSVEKGSSYDLSVNLNTDGDYTVHAIAWIDWNQDFVFDTATEQYDLGVAFNVENGQTNLSPLNINIPSDASLGNTRMRIASRYDFDPSGPCDGSDDGEIEDYTINVIAFTFVYTDDTSQWSPNDPATGPIPSISIDNIEVLDGTANITQELVANNLEISSGASLNISPSGVLDLAGDITNNGDLVLQSDENGTAQLAEFTGSITGDVKVERYIPAKRAFRLVSSAVGEESISNTWLQHTHITGVGGANNGFDATGSNNPSIFTFDNTITDQSSGAGWQAVTSTTDNISAGKPYRLFVRGDRSIDLRAENPSATATTLSATGSLHTGSYSPTLATAADNYSFVGNPYQAVVDFGAVTTTNLTGYLYVWDASIEGENGNGGYTVVDVSDGSKVTGISPYSSAANQYIMPGQAFFVQNTADGNGSITFEEADKATGQAQVSVFSTNTNFYINSRLYKASALQNGEMESDAIGLRFNKNYTTIGSDEDASKLANPGENYAIYNNGFKSIDKQNIPTDGHQIELILLGYESSNYSLTFDIANQPETLSVYLNDDYLNKKTELTENTIYDFTIDTNVPESIDRNRFHLSFQDVTLNNKNFDDSKVSLYPNPVVNQLQIKLPASVKVNSVQIFNLLGQAVQTSEGSKIDVSELISGIYLVEVETSSGKVTKKIIKK